MASLHFGHLKGPDLVGILESSFPELLTRTFLVIGIQKVRGLLLKTRLAPFPQSGSRELLDFAFWRESDFIDSKNILRIGNRFLLDHFQFHDHFAIFLRDPNKT